MPAERLEDPLGRAQVIRAQFHAEGFPGHRPYDIVLFPTPILVPRPAVFVVQDDQVGIVILFEQVRRQVHDHRGEAAALALGQVVTIMGGVEAAQEGQAALGKLPAEWLEVASDNGSEGFAESLPFGHPLSQVVDFRGPTIEVLLRLGQSPSGAEDADADDRVIGDRIGVEERGLKGRGLGSWGPGRHAPEV